MRRLPSHQSGMTLIEVLIAIAIFAIVTTALYVVIDLGIHVLRDDQARLDGLSIAQSQIEAIKNVPYTDVGTVSGIPNGVFESTSILNQNQTNYTVETDIRYIDDPFDGLIPTDTVNTDYKKVRVEVTWEGQFLDKPIILITTVVPNGIETTSGGGTLWIEVYTAAAAPVSGATVRIINTDVTPNINITSVTDSQGRYILPGAPASVQSYQITVSKSGYSTEQTYSVDPENNPNPDPGHQTVIADEVTTKTFYIDRVSQLQIQVNDYETNLPQANVPLQVVGNKRIGTDLEGQPIPKYSQVLTTNLSGVATLTNAEYDTYDVTLNTSLLDYAGSNPHIPYVLAPNANATMTYNTALNTPQTLLVTVLDPDQTPVSGASINIQTALGLINLTKTTNSSGQAFFSPLIVGTYTVEVTASGFTTYTSTLEINDDELISIPLTAS